MSDEGRESAEVAASAETDARTDEAQATADREAAEESPATRLADLERELTELREKNLRLMAELRNQQQRAQRERAEALKYAEAEFARAVLPVLDDLERTLASAARATDAKAVAEGVRIVYEHFLKILRAHHIVPIEAVGKRFDPDVHEALMQRASREHPAGVVIEEVARGYRMFDRVIRPARVIVSSGPPSDEQKNDETAQSE